MAKKSKSQLMRTLSKAIKPVRQRIEGFATWAFCGLCSLFPVDTIGGAASKFFYQVGRYTKASTTARRNIKKTWPHLSDQEIEAIVKGVWDNAGRLIAEYSNPESFRGKEGKKRIEVIGLENFLKLRDDGKPGIIFSGHIGNWQAITHFATENGLELTQLYRTANSPWTDREMLKRQLQCVPKVIRKGRNGSREIMKLLNDGGHLMILVDQKLNEGIEVPFLRRPAMTAPAIARMALRYGCPVVPAWAERVHDSYFRVYFEPPIEYTPTGDLNEDTYNFMLKVNQTLDRWVNKRPDLWFWLHNRWKD